MGRFQQGDLYFIHTDILYTYRHILQQTDIFDKQVTDTIIILKVLQNCTPILPALCHKTNLSWVMQKEDFHIYPKYSDALTPDKFTMHSCV